MPCSPALLPRASLSHSIHLFPVATPSSLSCNPHSGDVASRTASLARRGHLAATAAELSSMLSCSPYLPSHGPLLALLSACADFSSSPLSLPLGLASHSLVLKLSLLSSPSGLLLSTALIDFYNNAGFPVLARRLFNRMPFTNIFTHNTMIAGHMKNAEVDQALALFRRIPARDLVTWTAIIDGCVKNGLPEKALQHFRHMEAEGVDPDYVTAVAVAAACSDLGALGHGLWLHHLALRRGLLQNVRVGNALVDMYSRCGRPDLARQVFDKMPTRTRVTWNSMIMGLAVNGCSSEALQLFSAMEGSEFHLDGISFTAALAACSHAGLTDDGLRLFRLMQEKYGIEARVEHYGCLVDLLARAGMLEEALDLIDGMPMKPNEVLLGSIMAGCRMHGGDAGLAERLMALFVEERSETESSYVLLSNIYAGMGRWESVGKVRCLMKDSGVRKKPGFSAVEIGGIVHQFVAGGADHSGSDEIYALLSLLHFDLGYEAEEAGAMDQDFSEGYID